MTSRHAGALLLLTAGGACVEEPERTGIRTDHGGGSPTTTTGEKQPLPWPTEGELIGRATVFASFEGQTYQGPTTSG